VLTQSEMTQRSVYKKSKPIPIKRQNDDYGTIMSNEYYNNNKNDGYGSIDNTVVPSTFTHNHVDDRNSNNIVSSSANTASTYSLTTNGSLASSDYHNRTNSADMLSRSAPYPHQNQRWSLFSSLTRNTSDGKPTNYVDESIGRNVDSHDNVNDNNNESFLLSKSPSSRGGIWNVEGTITPMTSRPHFCTIQQVIQHQQQQNHNVQHQQQQFSSPYNSWRRSESARPVDGEVDDTVNNNYKLSTFPNFPSLLYKQSTSFSQDKNDTEIGTDNTNAVETGIVSPGTNAYYSYGISPKISSSPLHHRRMYNSGDMLLVPSLFSSTGTTTTSNTNHTTGFLHQQMQQHDDNNEDRYNDIYHTKSDVSYQHNFYNQEEHEIVNQQKHPPTFSSDIKKDSNNDSRNDSSASTIHTSHTTYYSDPITVDNNGFVDTGQHSSNGNILPKSIDDHDNYDIVETTSSVSNFDSIIMCIIYGCINATIVLPILISFGSIIYRHDAFVPYQQKLVSLTLFSGIVHQISFSLFSSLPFAVGQVQDAGLIFLSSIASAIVDHCQSKTYISINNDDDNYNDTVMLATVTVLLGCCTAVLGLALIIIGRFQLAQYVQLLPTG
jgi:hypothetical protein